MRVSYFQLITCWGSKSSDIFLCWVQIWNKKNNYTPVCQTGLAVDRVTWGIVVTLLNEIVICFKWFGVFRSHFRFGNRKMMTVHNINKFRHTVTTLYICRSATTRSKDAMVLHHIIKSFSQKSIPGQRVFLLWYWYSILLLWRSCVPHCQHAV